MKVYIVRSGEMGRNINMVTTDRAKAEAKAEKVRFGLEMSGSWGNAWIEEYEVEE